MAAVYRGEITGQSGELTNQSYKATRKFLVWADSEAEAINCASLPAILDSHPWYASARARTKSADEQDPVIYSGALRKVYEVSVAYETPPDSQDPEEENENLDPTLDPPIYSTDEEEIEILADGTYEDDRFATGILKTSAGEPFDPPITKFMTIEHLTLKVNSYSATPLAIARTFRGFINENEWAGYPAHSVRFVSCKPVTKYKNGVPYIELTYKFRIKYPDWDSRPLDQGTYYLDEYDNKVQFKNKSGENILGLLNGSGGEGDPEDPVFLDAMQIYPSKDFADLDLPTTGWNYG